MTMELEQQCPDCNGRGSAGKHACFVCHGKGTVPTPEGQAILALVEKYGGKPLDTIGY